MTATVMATATTKTGEEDDNNRQQWQRQWARMATIMGKDDA
jgi:hypothetical protein